MSGFFAEIDDIWEKMYCMTGNVRFNRGVKETPTTSPGVTTPMTSRTDQEVQGQGGYHPWEESQSQCLPVDQPP